MTPSNADARVGHLGAGRRGPRRIGLAIWRRLNPSSTRGLTWKRQGDHITFDWAGFVAAPSIPLLFARHHYETQVIRDVLAERPVTRSLEFGCGYGRLTPTFAALSQQHTAIDINDEALAAARAAYPDLDFQLSEGGRLPFDDDSFDLVVSWTVLQHVRPDLIDGVLDDILRVLRPGGRILMCEETRNPGGQTRHSWHRERRFYEERLAPLTLTHASYIDAIDRVPGLVSPGEVMLFDSAQG